MKRNNTYNVINTAINAQIVKKDKIKKQSSNVELAKLEKKDKSLIENKKYSNFTEKETLKTDNTSNYGSCNKNDNVSSPNNEAENLELKYSIMITTSENTSDINSHHSANFDKISTTFIPVQVITKVEEKVDLQVLIERKNTCLLYSLDRFLGKHDIPPLLGVNKKIATSAIHHLTKMVKNEIPLIEEKIKLLKEVNMIIIRNSLQLN